MPTTGYLALQTAGGCDDEKAQGLSTFPDCIGMVSANVDAIASYAMAVHGSTERGFGILAEKANHYFDQLLLRNAQHVGGDNMKNGADRIVNGQYIQTKYCRGGAKSIDACFDKGRFRYRGPDGRPMQIEVPREY
jgi:hypothetical protein